MNVCSGSGTTVFEALNPLRQPFLRFALAVVLPCAVAMLLADRSARDAWDDLHRTSHAHVGRMVLSSLEQDLGNAVSELAAQATPYLGADPSIPSVQRAMAGDTVAGLTPTEAGAELAVMLGDATAPDTTQVPVRYAVQPLAPAAAVQVARSTGYETSLYLNGRLWGGTQPPPGPERLDEALLIELSMSSGGLRLPDSDAVLQADSRQAGTPPALVALASPRRPSGPAVELRILLVLGLLILFSSLAGWIQLARPPTSEGRQPGPGSVVTLALVPALTATLFLVHLTRTFEITTTEVTVQDLTRGLAVAGAREMASSPAGVRLITGFQATLVSSGDVLASTFDSDPVELTGLPAPPPSFTTSGTVSTPDGPSMYVALRRERGSVIVATTPIPAARIARFRRACLEIGGALLTWLLLAGGLLAFRVRHAGPAEHNALGSTQGT